MEGLLLIEGPVVHAIEHGKLEHLQHAFILVDRSAQGKIVSVSHAPPSEPAAEHVRLHPGQFICPGFIDTHHHAPQTQNMGLGLDWELLDWLQKITFPREQSYGDRTETDIRAEYRGMARRLLRAGTTTCVYFGSLQEPANELLAEEVFASGQRAFIGKVCMDQNSPAGYVETTEENLQNTVKFIEFIRSKQSNLINPIVTPRFAPTCSMQLMKELGNIALQQACHIQTHLGENKSEVDWVRELFPEHQSYTSVYAAAGLLTEKTILAHAIYLTDAEKQLIKEHQASISHCPNSNFALSSGCLCVRDLLDRGVKVALGTDVSGGYSPSMLDACRQAIIASKCISFQSPNQTPLTAAEAFSLATLGGASAINMSQTLGNIQPGKFFDALIVNVKSNPQIALADEESSLQTLFEKFIFCGDDRCIDAVFVAGRMISK